MLPCCWMAGLYKPETPWNKTEVGRLIDSLPGGRTAINARHHPIEEIIGGSFFQESVPSRWGSAHPERLTLCSRHCGSLDIAEGQYFCEDSP